MTLPSQALSINARLLKSKVTKSAVAGICISVVAMIIATVLSGYFQYGEVSLAAFMNAQKENSILWFLDGMPFLFAIWGQYVGTMMAYEAGAMIMDQTEDLRAQTTALENQAMHDATHDALTDLPNRVLFRDRVEQTINSARREQRKSAILLLDLDQFKEINDTMGHFNGDRILKQVAMRLGGLTGESDTLARMGGDEFALLLPTIASVEGAEAIAKKIRNALLPTFVIEGLTLDVQASIGMALFPDHGEDVDTLLQRADVAMYVAKQSGNDYVVYSPKLDQYSPQRLTLMGELRQAIENDNLFLTFQPKVDAQGKKVSDAEVLVRWQHKVHGMVPPDEFISLAERTGLIKQITRWVLKHALQQGTIWKKSGIDIGVSVNLSAKNLLDPEFPDTVAGTIASYDFPPSSLTLEITETAIMADPEFALEVVNRLAGMGVKISIDDFGTGYSSLAYLKKLPVTELKIDKSFVMDMLEDDNDAVIVQATIGMAHNLGLKVVAEGVENEKVIARLCELGCDTLQGYHFSKPLRAAEFAAWLDSSPWGIAKR